MDEITLSVEPQEEMEGSALEKLSARLSERLEIKILLRFIINFAIRETYPGIR